VEGVEAWEEDKEEGAEEALEQGWAENAYAHHVAPRAHIDAASPAIP